MNLLNLDELLLIAQRTLEQKDVLILDSQLNRGSNDLLGYMGEYYKLNLNVQTRGDAIRNYNLIYFVKSLPYQNEPQKAECERKGVFPKESLIYAKILPNIQKYGTKKLFPKCYYCRQDVIVLEDLGQNYRHLNASTDSDSLDCCKLILEHLSELHACSIAWEEKENISIDQLYGEDLNELLLSRDNSWFMTGLKGIIFLAQRHPDYQDEWSQKFIKEKLYDILLKTEEFAKPSKYLRNSFCHRDAWQRNIFFKFPSTEDQTSPSSCCLVDFQLAKYCSPCLDVLFVLYMVVSAEQRKDVNEDCLEHYFNSLQSHFQRLGLPRDLVTRQRFLDECEQMRLAGLLIFDYYLNEDRSGLYLKVIKEQPGYEQIIMTPIKELLEYILKTKQSEIMP
ncbi:uncharacterized protein Dwil_GK24716 [Drosophila willistoni]|uniref:CHK kinase-like domain-containing protein n=1 Tax=Drosophila willistoni TaxID=7260 RepID=B4MZT7_DROWI|nr:uncharacterized protein Dwil_GK24716 [Drosophila willistoni]